MTIHDFESPNGEPVRDPDIAVIGAGAAGITLALELANTDLSIGLFEAGGESPDPECQSLYDMKYQGYPHREGYYPRIRMFGGSTTIWAGRSMLLQKTDFQKTDEEGHHLWPILPKEIERYLPDAVRILGLPDLSNFELSAHAKHLSREELALLENSELEPAVSLWAIKPRRFGVDYYTRLRQSANIQVWLNASVTRLVQTSTSGEVEAIEIRSLHGRQHSVRPRVVVLACGGIENPRILLSTRDVHSSGLGNQSGYVGRFFMDHPRAVHGRAEFHNNRALNLARGLPIEGGKVQLGFRFSDARLRQERLLNHYCTFEEETSGYVQQTYQPFVEAMKVVMRKGHAGSRLNFGKAFRAKSTEGFVYLLSPKEIMPHWAYRLATAARKKLPRKKGPSRFAIVYFCEQPPHSESQIRLSDSVDRFGAPQVEFDWQICPAVSDHILKLEAALEHVMKQKQLGSIERGEGTIAFTDASHHLGTTRMAHSASHGVVDQDSKVFGTKNLYVAGSSVFPTAGHANPTLTLVAMSLRLGQHLKEKLCSRA